LLNALKQTYNDIIVPLIRNDVADINECATNNGGCSSDASCTNTEGSFTCACLPGYSGNGVTCTCGGTMTATEGGTLRSPSYPAPYPANQYCVWQISTSTQYRIKISFTDFQLKSVSAPIAAVLVQCESYITLNSVPKSFHFVCYKFVKP